MKKPEPEPKSDEPVLIFEDLKSCRQPGCAAVPFDAAGGVYCYPHAAEILNINCQPLAVDHLQKIKMCVEARMIFLHF